MQLWPRRKQQPEPEPAFVERRKPRFACSGCLLVRPPYVHLENGGHYCVDCVSEVQSFFGYAAVTRRASDLVEAE